MDVPGAEITHPVDPHRPRNVLYLLFSQILESEIELVAHLITNNPADADPAWLGEGFKSRRDIHPLAENVVFLNDHVAEVDPDPNPASVH
jgi:hypothetical protein